MLHDYEEKPLVILIQNHLLAKMMQDHFEVMWDAAEDVFNSGKT